jgi:hypothetical protein
MREIVASEDLMRAIAESSSEIRFVNPQGQILGRFEPELTPEEMNEIRRRLASQEPRYTTDQVIKRLQSTSTP